MPFRELITAELAKLLGALSHHDRLLILEELYQGEREVKALQKKLGISHSRVSQHLSLLRTHKVVTERRQGRHVFYRLIDPEISQWVMSALRFIEFRLQHTDEILSAVEDARNLWLSPQAPKKNEPAPRKLIYIPGRQGESEPPTQNEA
ncbi:MAG: helix-turn-helix transcriptional regulator [Candidatus Sericytochromatia bacterium]|nr:helix-turn-helix transcriptional regulator [Candidatus Sericytochromatia bacterium]